MSWVEHSHKGATRSPELRPRRSGGDAGQQCDLVVRITFDVVQHEHSARAARQVPVVERQAVTPVASIKQIMAGIVGPASTVVFNAVSTNVTEKGTEEIAPHTDEEWAAVGNSAAALAEAGNMLMLEGRAVDRGDWIKMSQAMVDAAKQTLKAVSVKSAEAVLESGETVNTSCDNCHQRYRRD
jgi:thiamine pyrophosphate-dependent acetolactate synthase large subunit-like protein